MVNIAILILILFLVSGCSSVHLGYFEMIVPIPWGTTPISLIADVGKHEQTEQVDPVEEIEPDAI